MTNLLQRTRKHISLETSTLISQTPQTWNLLTFFETMMSSFQLPVITLPTKINPKKHTIIDNIFTNQIHPDMKSGNLSISISDHLPSFFIIPKDNQNHLPKKQNLYTRNTKNFNRVNFILDYFDIDWDAILQANKNDVNLSMQIFLKKVNELLDKYMPLRKLAQKEYKRRFKTWITNLILDKIEKKNKAFRKYMNPRANTEIKEQLKTDYKNIKNEITNLTRQSKKDYYKQYFTERLKIYKKSGKESRKSLISNQKTMLTLHA